MKRRWSAAALCVALVACTGEAPEPEATGLPVPGGTLRVGVHEIGTLDPQRAVDAASLLIARSRYRGLYTLAPDGTVIEGLVDSVAVREGGRRYTFTIRSDARFSNGDPVTAGDVVGTLNRLVLNSTASPYATLLDMVDGFEAIHDGDATRLSGLSTDGPRRVRIVLSQPFALLTTNLAHPALGILPSEARDGDFGPSSPASGPFLLREIEPGRRAVLARNRGTARATAYLETLELTVVDDGARSLRAGAVDAAFVVTSDASRLAPRWGLLSLGIDPGRIKKPAEREMIASAIDREDIVSTVQQPWIPLERLTPFELQGDLVAPEPVEIDWPRAGELRFIHLNDPASRDFAAGIVRSCNRYGIRVRSEPLSPDAYADALDAGGFDLVQLGWLSEVPSPDGFIARQLESDSTDNQLGFSSAEFDRVIRRARRTAHARTRDARYVNAETVALEAAVLIPIVQLGVGFDAAARVHGAVLDGSGTFDAAAAWLDPAA